MIELCRLRRSERYEVSFDDVKPSQAMGAVAREPREGEIPVEPTAIGRLMTSQQKIGVSRTNRFSSKYHGQAAGRVRRNGECFISHRPQFCSAA